MTKGQSSSSSGSSRNGPPVVLRIYSGDRSPEVHTAHSGMQRGFSTKPIKQWESQSERKKTAKEIKLETPKNDEYVPPVPQLVLKGALQGERTLSSSTGGKSRKKKKRMVATEEKLSAEFGGTEFLIHPALLRFYNPKLEDAHVKKQEEISRANIFLVFFIVGVIAVVSAVVSAIALGDAKWYEYVGWALTLITGAMSIVFAFLIPFVLVHLLSFLRKGSDMIASSSILAVATVLVYYVWAVEGVKNDDLVIMDILFWSCFSWFRVALWKAWIVPSLSIIIFGAASFDMFTGFSPPLGSFMFVSGKFVFLFLSGLFGAFKTELEDRRDTFTSTALLDSIRTVQHSTSSYRDILGRMGFVDIEDSACHESTESDSIPYDKEEDDDMQILPNSPGKDIESKELKEATVVFVTLETPVDDLASVNRLVRWLDEANEMGKELGVRVFSATSTRSMVAVASDRSAGDSFARRFAGKEGAVVRVGSGQLVMTFVRKLNLKCSTVIVHGEGVRTAKRVGADDFKPMLSEKEEVDLERPRSEQNVPDVELYWTNRHPSLPRILSVFFALLKMCSVSLLVNGKVGVNYKFNGLLMRFSKRDAEERYVRRSARFFSRAIAPRGVFLILISVFYIWLVFAAVHEEGIDSCLENTSCYLPVAAVVFVLVPLFVMLLTLSSCHAAFFFVYIRAVSFIIILASLSMVAIFENVHAKMIWARSTPIWTGFCIFVLEVPLYTGWLTTCISLGASLGLSFGLEESCNGTFSALSTIGLHALFLIISYRKNLASRERFMLNECLEEELVRQQGEKEVVTEELSCRLPRGVERRIAKGVTKILETRLINDHVKEISDKVDMDDDDNETAPQRERVGVVCSVELVEKHEAGSVYSIGCRIEHSMAVVSRLSRKYGLHFIQGFQGRFILSIHRSSHEDYINRAVKFATELVDELSSSTRVCKVGVADGTILECIPFRDSAAGSFYVYAGSAASRALACTAALGDDVGGVNMTSSLTKALSEQIVRTDSDEPDLSPLKSLDLPAAPQKLRVKSSKMSQYSSDPLLPNESSDSMNEQASHVRKPGEVVCASLPLPASVALYVEGRPVESSMGCDTSSQQNAQSGWRRGLRGLFTR